MDGRVECNEAFATKPIHVVREMGFSEDIVNVNGDSPRLHRRKVGGQK